MPVAVRYHVAVVIFFADVGVARDFCRRESEFLAYEDFCEHIALLFVYFVCAVVDKLYARRSYAKQIIGIFQVHTSGKRFQKRVNANLKRVYVHRVRGEIEVRSLYVGWSHMRPVHGVRHSAVGYKLSEIEEWQNGIEVCVFAAFLAFNLEVAGDRTV